MPLDNRELSARIRAKFGPLPQNILRRGLASMTKFGRTLATILQAGDTLALVGELGAGKSNLVRVMMEMMTADYDYFVTSPTYTIANIYPTTPRVAHLDLYRLKTSDDFYSLGGDEYFDENTITLVEWADLLPEVIPPNALWLGLIKVGISDRRIVMADSYSELMALLQPEL